jgi:outer membrane protein assembly factor BamD (BamD/ComL family)
MRNLLIISALVAFIVSCKTNPEQKAIEKIKKAEQELYASEILDKDKGIAMIELYLAFAKQYSEDSISASYLYKAADIAMNLKLGSQSVLYLDKIMTNYPTYSKVPESLFLKGFILENQLSKIEEAGQVYKLFLERYPNHPFAKDARASLEYLGKSPEEIVRMFEEKQKTQSAQK